MINCGVSATTDPAISALWEQHGNMVYAVLVYRDGHPARPPIFLNGQAAADHLKRGLEEGEQE